MLVLLVGELKDGCPRGVFGFAGDPSGVFAVFTGLRAGGDCCLVGDATFLGEQMLTVFRGDGRIGATDSVGEAVEALLSENCQKYG